VSVFHGTSKSRLRSILKEGLIAGRFRNWDLEYYSGKRKGMVYVTKDLDDAIYRGLEKRLIPEKVLRELIKEK